jgi:hypothetical protein
MRPTPKTITAILDELMIEDQKPNMKTFKTMADTIQITKSGKIPTNILDHRTATDSGTTVLDYTRDGINVVISVTDDEERPDLRPEEVLRTMEFVPQKFDDVEVYAVWVGGRRVKFDVWNEEECVFYGCASLSQ